MALLLATAGTLLVVEQVSKWVRMRKERTALWHVESKIENESVAVWITNGSTDAMHSSISLTAPDFSEAYTTLLAVAQSEASERNDALRLARNKSS